MNETQTMVAEEETVTTTVTVEEVEGDRWLVRPGVTKVKPGESVKFDQATKDFYVFIMDDRLFGGAQRFKVSAETGPLTYEVATRERGLFPYVVLVDAEPEMKLAEGSALPVFVVDY